MREEIQQQVQESLLDQIAYYLRDTTLTFMAGMGITLTLSAFVGGLFLAAAGTAYAFRRMPPVEREKTGTTFWGAMFGGMFVAVAISIVWPHLPVVSGIPAQFGMLLGGFLSAEILRYTKTRAVAEIRRLDDPQPPPPPNLGDDEDNRG